MVKRKLDSEATTDADGPSKRAKIHPAPVIPAGQMGPTNEPSTSTEHSLSHNKDCEPAPKRTAKKKEDTNAPGSSTEPKSKVRKLEPPRPFPTVPASVSATGPRSAHTEGKNYICITRRTELGAYLRRCKDVFLKDGYKTLHLSAMGAAIPHLMQLILSLPPTLPFPADEISTEILTGTVEIQDELIPDDEDEDISYRTRGKSSVSVVITIGDGVGEPAEPARKNERKAKASRGGKGKGASGPGRKQGGKGKVTQALSEQIVIREDELYDA